MEADPGPVMTLRSSSSRQHDGTNPRLPSTIRIFACMQIASRQEKDQTVRRARPLALRRAITFRPFLVLMRFRNPCSRFFFKLDGC